MNIQIAREFLTRCFIPGENIAVLLRREAPVKVTQRIVKLEAVLASRYLTWLSHENASGANVYVAANPLLPGSRRRTKDCVATVRHLYLDIDSNGEARLAALRSSPSVPAPTAILSTSQGKYQVLWRVEGFDIVRQESTLKQLAIAFGGDSACTDCNRVLRIPGFFNCKYSPAYSVTAKYPSDSVSNPLDFRLATSVSTDVLSPRSISQRKGPSKHSSSENDWAWVSYRLSQGADAVKLTRELASRRSDKPNPLYYAQRTIDIASARLWLMDGVLTDDVITMIEFRRCFEIPNALCSARAREIATTAERMVGRRKIA
jgi:hypothetical protein